MHHSRPRAHYRKINGKRVLVNKHIRKSSHKRFSTSQEKYQEYLHEMAERAKNKKKR